MHLFIDSKLHHFSVPSTTKPDCLLSAILSVVDDGCRCWICLGCYHRICYNLNYLSNRTVYKPNKPWLLKASTSPSIRTLKNNSLYDKQNSNGKRK